MQLPPAYITSLANLTNTGVTTQSILLSPLLLTQSGIITDFVPLQWNTTYPGAQTAMERLYYSTSYQEPQTCGASPWVGPFDTQTGILPGGSSETSSLDVRTLPRELIISVSLPRRLMRSVQPLKPEVAHRSKCQENPTSGLNDPLSKNIEPDYACALPG